MNNKWCDFNDAESQFSIIPKGTVVTVRMKIVSGGHDDFEMGWSGGFVTVNNSTGSAYLNCQYTILDGKYANRKVRGNIGLRSPKGTVWGEMGRAFIKAALNSARGILPTDTTRCAQAARRINDFGNLNGLTFTAIVDVDIDNKGDTYNVIKTVIEPGSPGYVPPPKPVSPLAPVYSESDYNDAPF